MTWQWDVRELEWYGVNCVQVGDTIKNEDGSISKVVRKDNGVIWTDADEPVKNRLRTIICLTIKILFSPFWLIMFVLMWLLLIAFNTKDMDILWNYWRINDR